MAAKFELFSGYEVWQWPEFQAFADRLGIDRSLPTRDLNIYLPLEGAVTITQEYLGDKLFEPRRDRTEPSKEPGIVEATTVHNEQFKTFMPVEPCLPDQQDVEGATDA